MSFLSKFKLFFEKMFGTAPQWIHYAQVVVTFAAPFATSLLTVFAPEILPVAAPIIAEVQADLATVAALTSEGSATPSLLDAINRIQSNLTVLLNAGHITDPASQAKATLIVSELKALVALLPTSTAPATPVTAA